MCDGAGLALGGVNDGVEFWKENLRLQKSKIPFVKSMDDLFDVCIGHID